MCRTQPAVAIENKPTVAMHPRVATEIQPAVAMHPAVATETQPAVAMHLSVAIEHNPRLQPLAFYSKKQRLRKTVVLRSLFASAETLFGAVIQRL